MSRYIGLHKSTAFYRVRYACKHTGLIAQWIGTDEAQKAAEQEMARLSNEMCPQCSAWQALQSVPSYVETKAREFAAEPIPLAERGQLNGDRAWSLLR